MMPAMSSAGVTSNAGLYTGVSEGAVWRPPVRRTSSPARSSMGMAAPDGIDVSMVEKGAAM